MESKQYSGLGQQVFFIAWPAAIEALLVGIVDLVDMGMVSSLGLAAVSAIGITSQPKRILLMFTLALNVGATALVSRRIGEKDQKGANHCLHQFLWVSVLLAFGLYTAGIVLARPLMLLAGANEETLSDRRCGIFSYPVSRTDSSSCRADHQCLPPCRRKDTGDFADQYDG